VPDELRSPIKHYLVLHRIDPEQGIWSFYSLIIERDLFGTIYRSWSRPARHSSGWPRRSGGGAIRIYDFVGMIVGERRLR
jgi:hypothetical protein